MDVRSGIILIAIQLMNGKRSLQGVYHLLKGKRSAQTIQDGFLFSSLYLFQALPRIKQESFEKEVDGLLTKGLIQKGNNQQVAITTSGEQAVKYFIKEYPIVLSINGWKYKNVANVFWLRLALLVQCLSNLTVKQPHFIPIVQDKNITAWVKAHFPASEEGRKKLLDALYNELTLFLQKVGNGEATILAYKLSGYQVIGLTDEQIARLLQVKKTEVEILFKGIIHLLLSCIEEDKQLFLHLHHLVKDISQQSTLTHSTAITHQLLKKGWTVEEIMQKRKLKKNTIEDHIVEISMAELDFSIELFVPKPIQEEVFSVIKQTGTSRLREIKKLLPDNVTYFQIRLVLTKIGVME